jgi:hypothetical protein
MRGLIMHTVRPVRRLKSTVNRVSSLRDLGVYKYLFDLQFPIWGIHCRSQEKVKKINRKGREGFTQRAQSFDFKVFFLCVLCAKSLRLCGKKTF